MNRRGLWAHTEAEDVFRELKVVSAQLWRKTPRGQHLELGIAENNLFIQLAAMGLSHQIFGARLLPIGTLYDPFIARGLDALNYACYQDARFMIVATPSGVTLAPEGGAHQSIHTPLIGIGQPGLLSYEPAYVDELAVLMRHGLDYMQQRQGRLGLSPAVDAQPAAAPAHAVARAGGRHRVAAATGTQRPSAAPTSPSSPWAPSRPRRSRRMRAWRATSPAPVCSC